MKAMMTAAGTVLTKATMTAAGTVLMKVIMTVMTMAEAARMTMMIEI